MSAILAGKKDPYERAGATYGKSKLIMIAHSQGNQMLETAYQQVFHPTNEQYLTNDEKLNVHKYLGVLNVASPASSETLGCQRTNGSSIINTTCKNEAIKLTTDLIIFGSSYVVQPPNKYAMNPNFKIDEFSTSNIIAKDISPNLPYLTIGYLESFLGTNYRHGMNEVYLSDKFQVRETSPNANIENLKQVFIRKLSSVAESLPSNCNPPKAVISYDENPAEFETSFTNKLVFSAKDSLKYSDESSSKGGFKNYKWTIKKFEQIPYDGSHIVVLPGTPTISTVKTDLIFSGPDFEEVELTFEYYDEFEIKLEVEREDGEKSQASFTFKPKLKLPFANTGWLSQCYKYDSIGNYAFYFTVEINNHNNHNHRYKLYFDSIDKPTNFDQGFGIFPNYLAYVDIWGVGSGANVLVTYYDSSNYVLAEQVIGNFVTPQCDQGTAFLGVRGK